MASYRALGFTYIGVLVLVAVMGILLAGSGNMWRTHVMREREEELLFVGDQYRRAVELYFTKGGQRYPRELSELIKDPRFPDTRRYLRKLYRDPITGKAEWGLVKSPDGGIAGVYSLSDATPFKTAGFTPQYAAFEGKEKYSEWQFVYAGGIPARAAAKPAPGPTAK